jgi:hypothetical protein
MASPWSVFIPAAAAATFAATWLLTPGPQAGAAAPVLPVSSPQAKPVAEPPVTAIAVPPARPKAVRLARVAWVRPARPAAVRRATRVADNVYYPGCNAVRAAGKAPLYRGQPGYRPEMDGDDDGIACEAHRYRW